MNDEPHKLPGWATSLLERFCPPALVEEIEGDLAQRFERDIVKLGRRRAIWRLTWTTIKFFRPGILARNSFSVQTNRMSMLTNYFAIAFRGMMRNKVFTSINVLGLGVGMAAFVLIVHYVSFELSFDRGIANHDRIYRVTYEQRENGVLKNTSARNLIALRSLLVKNFPEVTATTGFWKVPANHGFTFGYDGKIRMEPGEILVVDTGFFDVFSNVLVKGNPNRVVRDPKNVVISQRIANKTFAPKDPVGIQISEIDDFQNDGPDLVIAGVVRDLPENSHFHADFIVPMDTKWDTATYYWDGVPSFHTYVTIKPGASSNDLESRLNILLSDAAKNHKTLAGVSACLQPMDEIHLGPAFGDELEAGGSMSLVWILIVVGAMILVIAWINYVNLETAQFLKYGREIAIRRIIGSSKRDLALQFLVRYFCLNIFSILIATILLYLGTPRLRELIGLPLATLGSIASEVWLVGAISFVTGSVLVGIYPALHVLHINPVTAIKGNRTGEPRNFLRSSLVVTQFTASLILIASLIVVSQQLDFMKMANKKIDVNDVITIVNFMAYSDEDFSKKKNDYQTLKQGLLENSSIKQVCSSSAIPGTEVGFTLVNEIKRNVADQYDPTRYKLLFVDYDYIPLYGLRLLAGRNFNEANGPDENKSNLILNESAVRALGFSSVEEAIDKEVSFPLWPWMSPRSRIIGILEDYNHEAIKKPVMPTIYFLNLGAFQQAFFSVRLNEGTDKQAAISQIEKGWKKAFPDRAFEYYFLDDYYDRQFKSELHFARVFGAFSAVALSLACLGLFGMTLFEANSRLKELSIRKVLGASVGSIITLFSMRHARMTFIAALISAPLIWYFSTSWLREYPVHIELDWTIVVIPVGMLTVVTIATTWTLILRAANTNAVQHLRNE